MATIEVFIADVLMMKTILAVAVVGWCWLSSVARAFCGNGINGEDNFINWDRVREQCDNWAAWNGTNVGIGSSDTCTSSCQRCQFNQWRVANGGSCTVFAVWSACQLTDSQSVDQINSCNGNDANITRIVFSCQATYNNDGTIRDKVPSFLDTADTLAGACCNGSIRVWSSCAVTPPADPDPPATQYKIYSCRDGNWQTNNAVLGECQGTQNYSSNGSYAHGASVCSPTTTTPDHGRCNVRVCPEAWTEGDNYTCSPNGHVLRQEADWECGRRTVTRTNCSNGCENGSCRGVCPIAWTDLAPPFCGTNGNLQRRQANGSCGETTVTRTDCKGNGCANSACLGAPPATCGDTLPTNAAASSTAPSFQVNRFHSFTDFGACSFRCNAN